MGPMTVVEIIEGIISSVPEAIAMWNKIAPFIMAKSTIPADIVQDIQRDAPVVHSLVDDAQSAIRTLVDTHMSGTNKSSSTPHG